MATTVAVLEARLEANARDFERGIKGAEKQLDKLEGKTKSTSKSVGGLNDGFKKFAGLAVAGFGLSQGIRVMDQAVNAAANLDESINAVNVVFGDAAETITAFAGDTTDAVFETETAINQMATTTGAMLQNFGFNAQEAADTTVDLTKRAADMASVFNVDVSEAMGAINAALRGETEQIRKFGVGVDAATVKAKALEMGLIGVGDELDMNAKAAATVALVMEQTAKVQGDAANTADSYANRQRALNEQFAKMQVELGRKLLPVWEQFQQVALDLIPLVGKIAEGITPLLGQFASLADQVGKVTALIPDFSSGADDAAESTNWWSSAISAITSSSVFGLLNKYNEAIIGLLPEVSDETDNVAGSLDVARRQWQQYNKVLNENVQAAKGTQRATEDLAKAQEEAAEKAQAQRDAMDDLRDAAYRVADPLYDAWQAEQDLIAAQDTLNELIKEGKEDTPEFVSAMFDLAAAEGAAEAAAYSAAGGLDRAWGATENWLKSLGYTETQIGEVKSQWEELSRLDDISKRFTIITDEISDKKIQGGGGGGGGAPSPGGGRVIGAVDNGGVIPGPIGAPQLVMAHGGETFIPTHKAGFKMGGDTIVIPVTIGADHLDTIIVKGNERATRRGRL